MAVEGLDTGEDLAVVSARDQDLGARANGGLEDGEGAGGELMLFDLCDFVFTRQQSASSCYKGKGIYRWYTHVNSERGFERSSLEHVSAYIMYRTGTNGTYWILASTILAIGEGLENEVQRCATVWESAVSYEYACVCLQIFSVHVLEGMESLADGCTDQDEVY
jgi:hypothetical protein